MMRKLYGWEYFDKLEENNSQIGLSINDTVTMLNAGERAIGAGPSATTLISASRGNPLGLIYPEDGTLLIIAPSGILANSEHPNAAKLFMDFLVSPQAGKVSKKYFGESLRLDGPPPQGRHPHEQVHLIRPHHQDTRGCGPEVKAPSRATFGA